MIVLDLLAFLKENPRDYGKFEQIFTYFTNSGDFLTYKKKKRNPTLCQFCMLSGIQGIMFFLAKNEGYSLKMGQL